MTLTSIFDFSFGVQLKKNIDEKNNYNIWFGYWGHFICKYDFDGKSNVQQSRNEG